MTTTTGAAGGHDILASLLEADEAGRARLSESVRTHAAALGADELADLRELVWPDLFSEYDARFLSAHLAKLDLELGAHFRACERIWARDEELHYLGFRAAYAGLSGRSEAELEEEMRARRGAVDFAPLADLFAGEFEIACLMAYDELATVRAYRSGLERYARLGPEMLAFVRCVIADEGRHSRNFLKLLREEHPQRLRQAGDVIDRIRDREGVAYGNTFVLDHDDGVWSATTGCGARRCSTTPQPCCGANSRPPPPLRRASRRLDGGR
jgi:hypothetical protein